MYAMLLFYNVLLLYVVFYLFLLLSWTIAKFIEKSLESSLVINNTGECEKC